MDCDRHGMMPGARLAIYKILLMTMVWAGWASNRSAAQDVTFSRTYPVKSASATRPISVTSTGAFRRQSSRPVAASQEFHQRHGDPVSAYASDSIQSARQSATWFRRIARSANPIVAKLANENADFAEQWADLAEAHDSLSARVSDATTKLSTTRHDLEDVRSKLDHYGLTPTVGLLLRHKREQLDEWQVRDSVTHFTSQELKRSRQEQLKLEIVRHDGGKAVVQTAEILAAAGLDASSAEHAAATSQIEGLLRQRHQWLGSLRQGYHDYQQKLGELDAANTALAELTQDYRKLIDRHVTWIRSGDPLSLRDVRNVKDGMTAFFASRRRADFGYALGKKWQANPVAGLGLLAFVVVAFLVRWRAKSWLVGIGKRKRMRGATAKSRNVAAGVLTTVVALAVPSILYAFARWLGSGVMSEPALHASSGFYAASMVALMVEVPRQLLRRFGYLDKHVDVELPRRQRAAMYLTIIGAAVVLAAYLVTVTGLIDHGMWRDSAARFVFLAAMLLVAWTAHLALRPTGGLLEPLIAKIGGSVIHRVRFVVYLAGVAFPLAMMALSSLGYGFTANELIKRAIITLVGVMIAATLWPGVKIISAHAWQMLTGSKRPPREFDEYGEITTAPDGQVTGVLGEHFLELKHHLAFLCQCALVLAAIVCFGWLWIDIFPNARMGNPVVWTVQDNVTRSGIDAAGQTITNSVVETRPVTALHLLLASATLFVAFQLAKLLPALFDALVLQRVSFDEGMEHLSLVLGRCLLFGVGCLVACKLVGVRWQAIQWLAVGLTIGLGFGLQDLVRNLFGGLIVLFEKPARLGDLITVGRVTGRVSAQKLRTTVLSDEEGRELIIPNKNFVSEDVVNWMAAGRVSVIPIEVAVSRDERPADLCRTLQELVIDQADVLLSPAPQATLVCVGKLYQRIEVRAWIEAGQDRFRFRDSLLKAVRKFLAQKNLLSSQQPSQPAMRDSDDEELAGTVRSQTHRSHKRSA